MIRSQISIRILLLATCSYFLVFLHCSAPLIIVDFVVDFYIFLHEQWWKTLFLSTYTKFKGSVTNSFLTLFHLLQSFKPCFGNPVLESVAIEHICHREYWDCSSSTVPDLKH